MINKEFEKEVLSEYQYKVLYPTNNANEFFKLENFLNEKWEIDRVELDFIVLRRKQWDDEESVDNTYSGEIEIPIKSFEIFTPKYKDKKEIKFEYIGKKKEPEVYKNTLVERETRRGMGNDYPEIRCKCNKCGAGLMYHNGVRVVEGEPVKFCPTCGAEQDYDFMMKVKLGEDDE